MTEKVNCDHCKKQVLKTEAFKTEWKEINTHWFYCEECEKGVFGNGNRLNLNKNIDIVIQSLKEIESLTRNPREYEPSLYSLNHIAKTALEKYENTIVLNFNNGSKIETVKSDNVTRGRMSKCIY